MNQTDTLHQVKSPFSFPGVQERSYAGETLFRDDILRNSSKNGMEQSVNNYLKTPEEMEAEFCFVINSRRATLSAMDDRYDSYGRIKKTTDGYMNIHTLDETLSGFMEENY